MKALWLTLGLAVAMPALASDRVKDTGKDLEDATKDAVEESKDALHTDSGAERAERHADRGVRTPSGEPRDTMVWERSYRDEPVGPAEGGG